jgi:hypothetical protein
MTERLSVFLAGATPEMWLAFGITAAAVALTLILAVRAYVSQRSRALLIQSLTDSTRSTVVEAPGAPGDSLTLRFEPPPEPFVTLQVRRGRWEPAEPFVALQRTSKRGKRALFRLEGTLPHAPNQELLWSQGRIPGYALRRGEGAGLWTQQRLDLTGSEYITRGESVAALQHILFELQRRYNPFVHEFIVRSDAAPHVILTIEPGHGFNLDEMPVLVRYVRSAGRSAYQPANMPS